MQETESGLVWVVVESSEVGETVVGVFSTLELAREFVSEQGRQRLEQLRVEGHALDAPRREPVAWQVAMQRSGAVESAGMFIGCNCQDDEEEYLKRSFIARGGESMHLIVFAMTPGQAIEAADRYRAWLQERGLWSDELTPLEPIEARAAAATL